MFANKTRLVALALVASSVLGACSASGPVDGEDTLTESEPLTSTSADIGQGYDSIGHAAKPLYCVVSTPKPVGVTSSSISMTLKSDHQEVARSLGLELEGSYGIYSAAASFVRDTKEDDRSVSYVFGGTMAFKDIQMGPDVRVTDNAATITDMTRWTQVCGDSYVSKITRGASLYGSMKLAFSSRDEKDAFQSKFKSSGSLGMSAALKAAQAVASTSVQVAVNAVQVGGDVTQLPAALKGASGATCGMGDVNGCMSFITGIENYASTNFPSQFRDSQGRPLTGDALDRVVSTTGYETHDWSTIPLPNLPEMGHLGPEANETLRLIATQYSQRGTIDAIKQLAPDGRRGSAMVAKQRAALDADSDVVSANLQALEQAWGQCGPTAKAGCQDALAAAKAKVKPLPAEDLTPWFDATVPGRAPFAADFVDLRGDGHVDLCVRNLQQLFCQMGVGGGFSDTVTVIGPLAQDGYHAPAVWMTGVRAGSNENFLCGPAGSESDPVAYCIPMAGGVPHGIIQLDQHGSAVKTPATATGTADARGIDGVALYGRIRNDIAQYYPGFKWTR